MPFDLEQIQTQMTQMSSIWVIAGAHAVREKPLRDGVVWTGPVPFVSAQC